jgi:hypothetical protein
VAENRENPQHCPITPPKLNGDTTTEETQEILSARRKRDISGGKARAAALTPQQRSEIARLAAQARWKKAHLKKRC